MFPVHAPDPAPARTVRHVVDQYLAHKADLLASGLIGASAVVQARRYLAHFCEHFGTMPVEQCRRGDLKRFLSKRPQYKSPHTKATVVGVVVACFRWAEEDGLLDRCPYARPRDLPACEPRQAITAAEVRAILDLAHAEGYRKTASAFRRALWFCWQTGVRTCEMRRVCWEHYDDARGLFELRSKTTAKTGRKRLIVLNLAAWRLIRWLRRHDPRPTGEVFLTSRGKPWDKDLFARRFRTYADAAGVRPEVSAYSCRHGFCVESLEAGAGERQIADLMGHTTTRYISWYGRAVQSKVDYLRETAELRRRKGKE